MATGLDLKLARVAADVRSSELAEAMGVSQSRITYLEGRRVVTAEAERRYREALATLTTKTTDAPSAA